MFKLNSKKLFFPIAAIISVVVMVFFISYSLSQESYAVSAFTEVGEHTWIVPEGVNSVDVLVVAGGGGGGKRHGAGGGAGGVLYTENYSVSSGQIINITVGSGGAGATSVARSTNGEDSVFSSLTAIGGGGGGQYDTYQQGLPGGSGGGSSKSYNAAGTPNQGNAGGAGSYPYNWGGGGGAGEPGYNGTTTSHGSGGDGLYYGDIFGNQYGENGWFGGGGGGGGHNPAATIRGFGGNGGGGDGGTPNTYQDGENGLPNTGGGGGGASTISSGTNIGGNGGSGIVLIKYRVKLGTAQAPTMYKGLVGYWSMDASDYNSANSRVTDKSSFENHGINSGATFTTDRFGKEGGGAMIFDGDYIEILNPINQLNLEQEWTVSAWVNIEDKDSQYLIKGLNHGLELTHDSTNRPLLYLNSGTNDYYIYGSASNLLEGQGWKHVIFIFRNSDGLRKIYIDGQDRSGVGPNKTYTPSGISALLKIGYGAKGAIDELRVYNRALSESEIQSLYNSYNSKTTTGTLQQGLVLDMPLKLKYTKDETPGSEIMTDRTPYSNDGQNYGATITSDGASFDGVDDYIRLPNEIISTANIRSKGVTYAAWIKLVNTGSSQKIIGQKPGSGYSDFSSGGLGVNTSNKAIMIAYDDGASYKYATGDTNLQSNVWHFLVGTYNPIDKNIRIYVDGLSDGTPVLINTFSRLNVNADNTIGR